MKNKIIFKTILMVFVCAVLTISLSAVLQYFTRLVYQKNLPLLALSENIKNKTTKGHLWFEEYMAGDASIDVEKDVIQLFKLSHSNLEAAFKGGETELGYIHVVEEGDIRTIITTGQNHILQLIDITNKRKENKIKLETDTTLKASGEEAGGEIDQKFDALYELVQEDMNLLNQAVKRKIDTDTSYIKNVALIFYFIILAIFLFLGYQIYIGQKRDEDKNILLEKEKEDQKNKFGQLTLFAEKIGQGDYSAELNIDSDNDKFSQALLFMRDKLKSGAEELNRRNWVNSGLASMAALLRTDFSDSEKIYHDILAFMLKYMDANQGGIFLLNDQNPDDLHLELTSCIAYDRRKFLQKKIGLMEGLVGRCYLEKESIFMSQLPKDYIRITSGLGDAVPSYLLLTPIKSNEKVFGVIELASFNPIETFHIEFMEKIGESLASTVSNMRTQNQTRLLLEQSHYQSEQLRSQEEEMRQNLEELSATQEEMLRKEQTYIETIETLKHRLGE